MPSRVTTLLQWVARVRSQGGLAPRLAYLVATLASLAALAARVALDDLFRGYPGLLVFLLPIMASAYLGGLRGGLLATVLALLASQFLLMLPLRASVFDAGSYRWVQLSVAIAGIVISALNEAVLRSTVRSRETARRLEQETARLVAAQSVAKVGSWATDLANGDVSWSEETHRIFETCPGAFAPTHAGFLERVYPEDLAAVNDAFTRSLLSEEPFAIEHRVLLPGGRVKTVEERWKTSFGPDGIPARVLGTCQDITERKQAQDALAREHGLLREAEGRYRSLFENSNDGIFQNTPAGHMITANQALATMLGFDTAEELVRARTDIGAQSYVDPELRHEFMRLMAEHGRVRGFEYQVRRKDGTPIWVSESVHVVRDAQGRALLYEGSVQDITERRCAAEEIVRINQALVEASRRAGMAEVATEVLHNVGNVLNSINVSASLLVDNVKVSRAARMAAVVKLLRDHDHDLGHYLTADPAGQHIPELLEDLSREWIAQQQLVATELEDLRANVDLVKRIVASQQGHARAGAAPGLEPVAIDQLLEEALRAQQGALLDLSIVREFESLTPIPVARHKVVQILASLLRNARQACSGLDEADRCIRLGFACREGRALISVADNGAGIAPDRLVPIFAPRFGARGGFGLHASALAAQALGGRLTVASAGPGRGATFTLELPMPALAAA